MKKCIAVLGDGAWGTAIATVLAHNGYTVKLWCYNNAVSCDIVTNKCNSRYLPGVQLSANIIPFTDMQKVFDGVDTIFEAIPVLYMRSVLEAAKPFYQAHQVWIVLSKGIETGTLLLPTQIIDQVFQTTVKSAVVSGPSFAYELARQCPTAVVVAAYQKEIVSFVAKLLTTPFLRVETSADLLGVALCGAYKNVIALMAGYLEGAGLGANIQAWAITRALAEMAFLVECLGGKQETVYGLSGLGDLLLTATGQLSKNRICGALLGGGKPLQEVLASTGYVPEGINTLQSLNLLVERANISLPLCQAMYKVVFEQGKAADIVASLSA
jgi:glycerol-3-phosphate dehydrogenase (NAD(P)+)